MVELDLLTTHGDTKSEREREQFGVTDLHIQTHWTDDNDLIFPTEKVLKTMDAF